jgi:hypothetical protein
MKMEWKPSTHFPGEWNLVGGTGYLGFVWNNPSVRGCDRYLAVIADGKTPAPPFSTVDEAKRYVEVVVRMEGGS